MTNATGTVAAHDTDIVSICSRLIRFDTTNYEHGRSNGESDCADYVESLLADTPFAIRRLESAPRRSNLIVTVPGTRPDLPALICHGHLDVVPADPALWTFDPFSGTVSDGYVYGRGAVDMKDFVAAMICVLRDWAASGFRPAHTTYFAFVADEETDGDFGAAWLVRNHPECFGGARYALGESGGMKIPWTDAAGRPVNFYPIASGERGTAHLKITAHGTAGHGSYVRDDNAVVRLADAVSRVAHHRWPNEVIATMGRFLEIVGQVRGETYVLDAADGADAVIADGADAAAAAARSDASLNELLDRLGPLADVVRRAFRPSSVPTMLAAGYKVNVIPEQAQACIDVRTLPGGEERQLAVIDELLGEHVTREFIAHEPALEAPLDTPFYLAIADALRGLDPTAVPVPFCTGGGSDAKAFSLLGIHAYGFSPSCAGAQGQQPQGAHGVDERVPVDSLRFAQTTLDAILRWR
ncbi:M20/M25/M40 family metallo-hydrolase [Bifidobacterium sp. 82T10]|uniref:M20/M25/M40 family metallo-hydrolase n=1 Tax=Bifidobacterium miconis TaxID=2834435 RepID=A0ABS6WDB8_9BIFI|nr:M20/M25/M40 family metallo-hydrolase [Bifidobacterium miconis]MBW3092049.1 M20/M25/M40 family metallo-hydrolase [Bifidobacterium miconis]